MVQVTYPALDIARFFAKTYVDLKKPATNMKLQKALYYSWIEYYRKNKAPLFIDPIYAWKFGPVVKPVYNEFRVFAGIQITRPKGPDNPLNNATERFLREIAKDHLDREAYGMMQQTHGKDGPWDITYDGNPDTAIPFNLIVDHSGH